MDQRVLNLIGHAGAFGDSAIEEGGFGAPTTSNITLTEVCSIISSNKYILNLKIYLVNYVVFDFIYYKPFLILLALKNMEGWQL